MKFTSAINAIATAIKSVLFFVPVKPNFPGLANVHIQSSDNTVSVTTSDLDTYLTVHIPSDTQSFGEILAPAKITSELLDQLRKVDGNVDFSVEVDKNGTETLVLEHQRLHKSRYTLGCMSADNFPEIPIIDVSQCSNLVVESSDFIAKFDAISKYTSTDKSRINLTGVHLANGKLWGSDGHKIAYTNIDHDGSALPVILNSSFSRALLHLCPESELITLNLGTDFVRVSTSRGVLIQHLIHGKDISSVNIPTNSGTKLTVNRSQLIDKLDTLRFMGDIVALSVNNECLELEVGDSSDEILIEDRQGSSDNFCLANAKLLLSALKNLNTDAVSITIGSEISGNIIPILPVHTVETTLKNYYPNLKTATTELGVKSSTWKELVEIVQKDLTLIAHIKQLDIYTAITTYSCIDNDGVVKYDGHGYARSVKLPYTYENNCLTVTDTKYDFACADDIPFELTYEYIEQKKQEEHLEQTRQNAVKVYYQSQPIELLKSSLAYCNKSTLLQLKKHYRTVKNFNEQFIGAKVRTWDQAVDSYNEYCGLYHAYIIDIINRPIEVKVRDNSAELPELVSVEYLKDKYKQFKIAKTELGIKAGSWQSLADKLNAKNKPIDTSNASKPSVESVNKPINTSSTSVESVIHQLKTKYKLIKLAKADLRLKAVSWQKLAELVIAISEKESIAVA